MSWSGDLRGMVLHEFRESARLKGARTPEDTSDSAAEMGGGATAETSSAPTVASRRRIVQGRREG